MDVTLWVTVWICEVGHLLWNEDYSSHPFLTLLRWFLWLLNAIWIYSVFLSLANFNLFCTGAPGEAVETHDPRRRVYRTQEQCHQGRPPTHFLSYMFFDIDVLFMTRTYILIVYCKSEFNLVSYTILQCCGSGFRIGFNADPDPGIQWTKMLNFTLKKKNTIFEI